MAECPGCESSRLVPQTVQNVRKRTCQHCCGAEEAVGEDQEWEGLIEGSSSEEKRNVCGSQGEAQGCGQEALGGHQRPESSESVCFEGVGGRTGGVSLPRRSVRTGRQTHELKIQRDGVHDPITGALTLKARIRRASFPRADASLVTRRHLSGVSARQSASHRRRCGRWKAWRARVSERDR